MKKLAVTLSLLAVAAGAFAQGTVVPGNTAATQFRTNAIAVGGTSGNSTASGAYMYEVLTAPSGVTTVDLSLQQLLSAPWSDTGIRLTNSGFATGGRTASAVGSPAVANFWGSGNSNSYVLVGWSVNEGSSWSALAANLAGAHLGAGFWDQGASLVNGGFIGATAVAVRAAGLPDGTGAPVLFGTGADSQGVPITTPTQLWVVNVPEPTSIALAGLGIAALTIFRRRK